MSHGEVGQNAATRNWETVHDRTENDRWSWSWPEQAGWRWSPTNWHQPQLAGSDRDPVPTWDGKAPEKNLKPYLKADASVVSIGISSQVTASNYGYMSPIKAALESASRFLAKSFSADSRVRFNSVNAGPLKTSASAGIPGYLHNYLHAEKMTFRKEALKTQEVADTAVWLLSPRSSGVNGQGIVVDAGMGWNFFDEELVAASSRLPGS